MISKTFVRTASMFAGLALSLAIAFPPPHLAAPQQGAPAAAAPPAGQCPDIAASGRPMTGCSRSMALLPKTRHSAICRRHSRTASSTGRSGRGNSAREHRHDDEVLSGRLDR